MIVTVFRPDEAEYTEMLLALEERTITLLDFDAWVLRPEHWVDTEVPALDEPCAPGPE